MDENDVRAKLDQLAEYQAYRDLLALDRQALVDKIITPKLKAQIAEIEAEFATKIEVINATVSKCEAEVKSSILELGNSVKGERLHAVWSKGRVSWNTKGLDGFAKAHPEIESFRIQGEPSVSIRKV